MSQAEDRPTRYLRNGVVVIVSIIASVVMYTALYEIYAPIDRSGAFSLAVALLVGAGVASVRPRWRPALSSLVGTILIVIAWGAALFDVRDLLNSRQSSSSLLLAVMSVAVVYVSWFRWAGKAELKRQEDSRQRELIAELGDRLTETMRREIHQGVEMLREEAPTVLCDEEKASLLVSPSAAARLQARQKVRASRRKR